VSSGVLVPDASDLSRRVLPFAVTHGRHVRVRALSELGGGPWASAAEIGVYARPYDDPPTVIFVTPVDGKIAIAEGEAVSFVGSSLDPEGQPVTYEWGLPSCTSVVGSSGAGARLVRFDCAPGSHTVSLNACDPAGNCATVTRVVTVQGGCDALDRSTWSLVSVDSQEIGTPATNAFDGQPDTLWHTRWVFADPPPPHHIVIDVGDERTLCGFGYLPRQDGGTNGMIRGYDLALSSDGIDWTVVASGELVTNPANRAERSVTFAPHTGRYVRLRALSEVNGQPWTSAAELRLDGF
jgi:hypothetical protein